MAFDIIGSREKAVAIIDKQEQLEKILKNYKHVKSVLLKLGPRTGKYRKYKLKLIWGDKNTEVIHKEYGYKLKLDPKKVYFSPREANERQRLAKLAKNNEKILVMFSGIAPISIAINKKKNCKITNIEINPDAVKYANENVKLNKLKNIRNILGNVKEVKLRGKFDRIIMPLPETAYKYLDIALKYSKKGTIIHLYGFSDKNIEEKIKKFDNLKLIRKTKVLPYGPWIYKMRYDIKVN
ncbi:MAG: methyltransferase domain-containing protein [Candidatus Aenigmarchaeota archaeon]|nr:methyltransferase domain-containing protein [Candidatus Aenigmarchaeota archaeon]